jgi:hypothetical protein
LGIDCELKRSKKKNRKNQKSKNQKIKVNQTYENSQSNSQKKYLFPFNFPKTHPKFFIFIAILQTFRKFMGFSRGTRFSKDF